MGCLRMQNEEPKSRAPWMTQGALAGLCRLIYDTDITIGDKIDMDDGFKRMKMAKERYQAKVSKSVLFGDEYLEVTLSYVA